MQRRKVIFIESNKDWSFCRWRKTKQKINESNFIINAKSMKIPLQCWLMTCSADHLKFDFFFVLESMRKHFLFFVFELVTQKQFTSSLLKCYFFTRDNRFSSVKKTQSLHYVSLWKMLKGKIIEKNNLQKDKTTRINMFQTHEWIQEWMNGSTARIMNNNTCVCLWK